MSYTSALLGTSGGGSLSGGAYQSPTSTLGQILDFYIVHILFAFVFFAGAIMLMARYGALEKPISGWGDFFFALGSVAIFMNVAFVFGAAIAWVRYGASPLSRQDDNIHWLHALSIFAAAFSVFWGILALILTFGTALTGTTSDQVEVGGYFMVFVSIIYFGYLTLRWMFGLAGKPDTNARTSLQASTSLDTNAVLAAIRAAGANNSSYAQPIFGGAGGAAAFGGIDLSGLQPSSMSTLPPAHAQPAAGCAPGMIPGGFPMMMMMAPPAQPQPAPCAGEADRVHIA